MSGQLSRKKVQLVTAVKVTLYSGNAHLSRVLYNMAASLSVEEVLEEVWNVEEMDEEKEVLPHVLKMCLDNFNCLRHSMCNYTSFQEDTKGMLRNVYSRHKTGVNVSLAYGIFRSLHVVKVNPQETLSESTSSESMEHRSKARLD